MFAPLRMFLPAEIIKITHSYGTKRSETHHLSWLCTSVLHSAVRPTGGSVLANTIHKGGKKKRQSHTNIVSSKKKKQTNYKTLEFRQYKICSFFFSFFFLHKLIGSSKIHYQLVRAGELSTYSRICGRNIIFCLIFIFKTFLQTGAEEVGARAQGLGPSARVRGVFLPGELVRLSSFSKQLNM